MNTLDLTSFNNASTFSFDSLVTFAALTLTLTLALAPPLSLFTTLFASFGGGGIASSFFEKVTHRFSVLRAAGLMHNVCTPANVALAIQYRHKPYASHAPVSPTEDILAATKMVKIDMPRIMYFIPT